MYIIITKSMHNQLSFQLLKMSGRRNRRHGGRSLADEKRVANTFVEFLEKESLKYDMLVSHLEKIYLSKFCVLYTTPVIPFQRILRALSYHLNMCQRLQDCIIFGSGETAALKLLSIEDADPDSGFVEESEPNVNISRKTPCCEVCKRNFKSFSAYENHVRTVSHRQQDLLKTIRESVER